MADFVTRDELKSALEMERDITKMMIEDATNHHTLLLSDIRASMRDFAKDVAKTAATCDILKVDQIERFSEMKKLIESHDGPIRRLRAYETLAAGGLNFIAGTTVLKWAKNAAVGLLGAGVGGLLFMMIAR